MSSNEVSTDAQASARPQTVSKVALILLAIFLGGIGADKLYVGRYYRSELFVLWSFLVFMVFLGGVDKYDFFLGSNALWTTWLATALALACTGITVAPLFSAIGYIFSTEEKINQKYSLWPKRWTAITIALVVFLVVGSALANVARSGYAGYYSTGKLKDALVISKELREKIEREFSVNGPSDMTCTPATCRFGYVATNKQSIETVAADKSGVITVAFNEKIVRVPLGMLIISPQINGKLVDLSDKSTPVAQISWKCTTSMSTSSLKQPTLDYYCSSSEKW